MALSAKTTKPELKRLVAKEVATQMATEAVDSKKKVKNPQLAQKPSPPQETSIPKPAKKK